MLNKWFDITGYTEENTNEFKAEIKEILANDIDIIFESLCDFVMLILI